MTCVLVIDDEPDFLDFLRQGLEAEGLQVTCVSDGIEGERRALAADVDLVVLDRMLRGRDGLDLVVAVHRHRPALPVIVISARSEPADRITAFDAGATDFLAKPFSSGELLARVRAQLRRAGWTKWTNL